MTEMALNIFSNSLPPQLTVVHDEILSLNDGGVSILIDLTSRVIFDLPGPVMKI